jgi:hypothetical protein
MCLFAHERCDNYLWESECAFDALFPIKPFFSLMISDFLSQQQDAFESEEAKYCPKFSLIKSTHPAQVRKLLRFPILAETVGIGCGRKHGRTLSVNLGTNYIQDDRRNISNNDASKCYSRTWRLTVSPLSPWSPCTILIMAGEGSNRCTNDVSQSSCP